LTQFIGNFVVVAINQSINIRLLYGCQTATIERQTMKSPWKNNVSEQRLKAIGQVRQFAGQ